MRCSLFSVRSVALAACSIGLIVAGPLTIARIDAQTSSVVIRAGLVIDGVSNNAISKALIVIENDRIVAVGPDVRVPAGARTIDLSGSTVLPGLIDAHTHVAFAPQDGKDPVLNKSIPFRALEGLAAARADLDAGFTTLRDTDAEGARDADVAVRDAINQGVGVGPRLLVSGMAISITGGHMNLFGLAPAIDARVPQLADLADSDASLVAIVRRQVKDGVDWIKLYATGSLRHIQQDTLESLAQFDESQVRLVVAEARRWRRDVAAHAYGGDGARAAVLGGVRSIEHGILLDAATLQLMAERGTFYVPTLSNFTPTQALAGYPEAFVKRVMARHREAFEKAMQLKVNIAFGTDAGRVKHGTNAGEFALMVNYGMSPMAAIQSSTTVAARLLRLEDRVGAVKPGLQADLIAVNGNPLENINVLQDVRFVMKAGVVVKHTPNSITASR
jgi:imidazolonepropionase-like amidohydrolase